MKNLVDVIIPCYNAELTIARCLDSVINQGEIVRTIILVDDCSTDATPLIISQYQRKLGSTRLSYQRLGRNSGAPSIVKNKCLLSVRADYVAFLDSDDEWLSGKLEIQIREMIANTLDYSYTSGYISSPGGVQLNRVSKAGIRDIFSLVRHYDIMTQGYVVSSSFIKSSNIMFDENIIIGEDFHFYMQVALRGRGMAIDKPTFIYYLHQTSITSRRFNRLLDGTRAVVRLIQNSPDFSQEERATLLSDMKYIRRLRLIRVALLQRKYSRVLVLAKQNMMSSSLLFCLTVSFKIFGGPFLNRLYLYIYKR